MRSLEGLLVKLWEDAVLARNGRGVATARLVTLGLVTLAMLGLASTAAANQAQTILEKCGHHEPFSGYSQQAYREALKQMTTTGSQYSACEEEIRKAEEAAAGGGAGDAAGTAGANVAVPLTPTERHAVQSAHRNGSAPVQVGGEPVRPGVVHADIASAVSTLPHSLFAVLAFMVAGAVVLAIVEVRKRVRSRRDS